MRRQFNRIQSQSLLLAAGISATLVLAACGGGGASTTAAASAAVPAAAASVPTVVATSATAVYFTDDFSAAYDAVWLNVSRVTVVSPTGETDLATFSQAKLLNLPTLRRTGALIATANIPANASAVRVYVGAQAKLQQLDGSMLDVALAAPTGYLEFKLDGWIASSGSLALDFDLPNFTLQGTTLVPATRIANASDFSSWNLRYAEVQGTVASVTPTSLVINTLSLGQRSITLNSNTTFVSSRGTTWSPAVGDRVEVKSAVAGQGATSLLFTASTVVDQTSASTTGLMKVEGIVTAVVGNQVTATIDHSENSGALGPVSFSIANATFTRGTAAALLAGVRVDAYLTQSGTAWTAGVIEIEGAAKAGAGSGGGGGDSSSQGFAKLKGQIASVTGSTVVVNAIYANWNPGLAVGAQVAVDLAAARFDLGSLGCLAAGLPIEIKGSVSLSGVLTPVEASVGGACATANPESGDARPSHQDVAVTSGLIDTEGNVTAVRAGEFDIVVFDLENAAMVSKTLTVRYDNTTVFRNLLASALTVGNFVEVKGNLNAGTVAATKVELH